MRAPGRAGSSEWEPVEYAQGIGAPRCIESTTGWFDMEVDVGVLFQWQDSVVWNPSLRMARLFVSQVRALEEAVGIESGFGDIVSDEVKIDPVLLGVFVLALVKQLDSGMSETAKSLMASGFAIAYGVLVACTPKIAFLMKEETRRLARRGEVLVSGKYWVGTIYEGLVD